MTDILALDPKEKSRLAASGNRVRERLAQVHGMYKVPTEQAEIWALGDFLTPKECTKLMRLIDEVAFPSHAYDATRESGHRTSYSGNMDPTDAFIRKIQRRFDDLLGIDERQGETVQGQRYEPGQEFKPHTDWFPLGTKYWEVEKCCGQRSITAMVYLNEVEEGGTTDFVHLGLSFEPKPGVLLVWNNARPDGEPNPDTVHAGRPVVKGSKYVLTKWYRTQNWH